MSQQCHARVRSEGRVTIDADLRRRLGLEHGDLVKVEVTPVDADTGDKEVATG
jgi:bifunctional DNA-binding transcriptional regulator/antitoxin component of YhaV-PrlF toxin-antitoxin module